MPNNHYSIPVKDTLKTAWGKVYGAKKSMWAAFSILFVIMFGLGFIQGLLEQFFPKNKFVSTLGFIINIVGYFLQMGTLYMGILRANDKPINFKMLFHAFKVDTGIRVALLYILQIAVFIPVFLIVFLGGFISAMWPADAIIPAMALYAIGFCLLVFLAIRMQLSMGFVLYAGKDAWPSIKASFKATKGNVWPLLALLIAQILVLMVSAIPLGIGLIWTLPFTLICYGTIYQRLQVNLQ